MKETGSEYFSSLKRSILARKEKKRSLYFQSIARHFFQLRGAPFFLSSKELDCIAQWEKMGVPLRVVVEGIKRSFENYRAKSTKKGKILSLAFCNLQVLKAFEQYRERKVGHKKRLVERDEKKERAREEVKKFLERSPSEIFYLREVYSRAQKILAQRHYDEEELELIEEEIEKLLLKNSSNEEKNKVKKEILAEYGFKREEEFMRVFRIKLIKVLRDKYRIPYISLFYY